MPTFISETQAGPAVKSPARRRALCVGLALAAALAAGCGPKQSASGGGPAPSGGTGGAGGAALRIAVIPKGTSHEYWKSIHAGAIKAQQELKTQGTQVDILWKGPSREDDRNGQVDVVQTFTTQQVSAIVLAPLDAQALTRPVADAKRQNIPVVVIDSSLNGSDYVSYVATDNRKGGLLGGRQLAKVLGGKGRVLLLRYQQGSASTEQREAGFLDAMKENPGITLISNEQYAGPTVETAYKSSQNLLSRFGTQVDGIFTPNESSTRGMRLAMKDAGLFPRVKFVGFDASADLIDNLKAGELQGLVVQNPFKMGYLSVKTAVAAVKKQPFDKTTDTGVTMVTKDNLSTPDVQALVNPPLAQYLK